MSANDFTFTPNEEVNGNVLLGRANLTEGQDNLGVSTGYTGGNVTVSRNITGAVGETSGTGNNVLGAGATYVESLDPATITGAFDFGTAALSGANDITKQFLSAFEKQQTQSQAFQGSLLSGFQGITEATSSTLRDALSATLKSDALAEPADTSAVFSPATVKTLAYVGAGLAALWLLSRK